MKKLLGFAVGAGLSFAVACGGSRSDDGSAGASGTGGAAGSTSGGSSNAGIPNSGGSASAGHPSAGASGSQTTGGSASAGSTTGGSATGGSSTGTCETEADCTSCMFPTAPQKAADCYCAGCNDKPLSKSACTANQMAFEAVCKNVIRPCPRIACLPPDPPSCAQHTCVGAK